MSSPWDPAQYHRFQDERSKPFHDLLAMVEPVPGGRVVDLGCGTGELTKMLHERTGAAETIGVDSSGSMLGEAEQHAGNGLRFVPGDIGTWADGYGLDVVFSNAALQWVDNHAQLIPRVAALVQPGGQLAFQVPANHDHISHELAHRLAAEEPARTALRGYVRSVPVQPPEWYAETLDGLGFTQQSVKLVVYGHQLESSAEVVEWVKGTLLNAYKQRMTAAAYEAYLEEYRARLLPMLGDRRPYFYPFKRILAWARKPV